MHNIVPVSTHPQLELNSHMGRCLCFVHRCILSPWNRIRHIVGAHFVERGTSTYPCGRDLFPLPLLLNSLTPPPSVSPFIISPPARQLGPCLPPSLVCSWHSSGSEEAPSKYLLGGWTGPGRVGKQDRDQESAHMEGAVPAEGDWECPLVTLRARKISIVGIGNVFI